MLDLNDRSAGLINNAHYCANCERQGLWKTNERMNFYEGVTESYNKRTNEIENQSWFNYTIYIEAICSEVLIWMTHTDSNSKLN